MSRHKKYNSQIYDAAKIAAPVFKAQGWTYHWDASPADEYMLRLAISDLVIGVLDGEGWPESQQKRIVSSGRFQVEYDTETEDLQILLELNE